MTKIESINFRKALSDRYLSYALSTIMSRSLPDVRDGLKPVNRRLLYAMQQLKLSPAGMTKKSARIIGDVIGKFHPHGEAAIYDALVRLAQDFTLRYPLIEGQGNFGNIDGDNAASMRYTEAKMTDVSEALLDGIRQNAVDFKATYDGDEQEPVVLPANFPNLLANGAMGIAVGMATSIPPHNLDELCQAILHMVDHPHSSVKQLLCFVQGPDFPTGGTIVDSPDVIQRAYETGRGNFRVRAKYTVENLQSGQWQIVVTEMPYHVQKGKLIERMADLLLEKKLPLLGDIQDESTEKVRLVLTPKSRAIDPNMLMATLFKHTDLEARFSLNMNVVDKKNVPQVMNLQEALRAFLDHRFESLMRCTQFRLGQITRRLEILDGYSIAFIHLDEVIRIIRYEANPESIIKEQWGLTDTQAEAILNMRLRALQKLEEISIAAEHATLSDEQRMLNALLIDKSLQGKHVKDQLRALQKKFGKKTTLGARRTQFSDAGDVQDIVIEDGMEREAVTIICSEKGWVRIAKGTLKSPDDVKYKAGDAERLLMAAETVDKLLIFVSTGKVYTLPVHTLPGGRGFGEPLSVLLSLDRGVSVVAFLLFTPQDDRRIFLAASDGRGFVTPIANLVAQTKNGKQILNVPDKLRAQVCMPVAGDYIAIVGENRCLLVFETKLLPEMTRGRGVILQKYRGGFLSDIAFFSHESGLSWKKGTRTYYEPEWEKWIGKRGAPGRFVPPGFSRSNKF